MANWTESENIPEFSIREITISETQRLISRLGNSTAFGQDEIDAVSLKLAGDYLIPPIRHIINLSIKQNTFVTKWKIARTIPVQKSPEASRMDPAMYRPISLLPTLSKLTERAVQQQLQAHFKINHSFHNNNHA